MGGLIPGDKEGFLVWGFSDLSNSRSFQSWRSVGMQAGKAGRSLLLNGVWQEGPNEWGTKSRKSMRQGTTVPITVPTSHSGPGLGAEKWMCPKSYYFLWMWWREEGKKHFTSRSSWGFSSALTLSGLTPRFHFDAPPRGTPCPCTEVFHPLPLGSLVTQFQSLTIFLSLLQKIF